MRGATRVLLALFAVLCVTAPAAAQQTPPAAAKLSVTVADPSGAVIPGATVRVNPQDDAAKARPAPAAAMTSAAGIAVLESLSPGRYTIVAEFAGFEPVTVKDYRVRAGDNRRNVTLPLKKVAEDVVVGRDRQTAGLDPRGNAFSTVLTREQIAALPDDPDEMEAALKAMSPPGAVMKIDGFSGGKLPPKSQIRSIRLPRMDQMAPQNHGGMTESLHAGQRRRGPAAGRVQPERLNRPEQVVVRAHGTAGAAVRLGIDPGGHVGRRHGGRSDPAPFRTVEHQRPFRSGVRRRSPAEARVPAFRQRTAQPGRRQLRFVAARVPEQDHGERRPRVGKRRRRPAVLQ
jgi:hypothetical protein